LIRQQLDAHIQTYLGSATAQRIITWEDIGERLAGLEGSLDSGTRFLVEQFRGFLDLIGIAAFNGFQESDFSTLGAIGSMSREEFMDFKAVMHAKIWKFMHLLEQGIGTSWKSKPYAPHVSRLVYSPDIWSAFSFHDGDPDIHVNRYPNVNFNFREDGIELSLNAETQPALKIIRDAMQYHPDAMQLSLKSLESDVLLYSKLQYAPQDHFIVQLIPGYPWPAREYRVEQLEEDIAAFITTWDRHRATTLYEMRHGRIRHATGRFFNEHEIAHASQKNPRPNFVFAIGSRFKAHLIVEQKRKLVSTFVQELKAMNGLLRALFASSM
jgi:hypothetical protein